MISKKIEISNIPDLVVALNGLDTAYMHRGHADFEWELETTFERVFKNHFEKGKNSIIEKYLISEFKSKFHLYDKENNLKPSSDLGWLSLMQHYGVPTRLLDFTQSPYVALYFALENVNQTLDKPFSIISINWKKIQNLSSNIIKSKFSDFDDDQLYIHNNSDTIYEKYLKEESIEVAWFSEPAELNKRLDLQMGSFLFCSNPGIRLDKILYSKKYSSAEKYEFIIDPKLFKSCYKLLQKMNINGKTIYGDLNGLGISLKNQLKSISSN